MPRAKQEQVPRTLTPAQARAEKFLSGLNGKSGVLADFDRTPGSLDELKADLQIFLGLRDRVFDFLLSSTLGSDLEAIEKLTKIIDNLDRRIAKTQEKIANLAELPEPRPLVLPPVKTKAERDQITLDLVERNSRRIHDGFIPWVPADLCRIDDPHGYAEYEAWEQRHYSHLNGFSYWVPGYGREIRVIAARYELQLWAFKATGVMQLELANRFAGRPIKYEIPETAYELEAHRKERLARGG